MTEFSSVVEFRADLQRQYDALDELLRANRAAIVSTEHEQEMVALQIVTVDQVMGMQSKDAEPEGPQTLKGCPHGTSEDEGWCAQCEAGLHPALPPPEDAALATVTPTEPAQPDDRHSEGGDRHPAALVEQADTAGLNPAAQGRDGSSPSGGTTERSVPRYPNPLAPDPRAITDTSPEGQAKSLRAAIEKAGAVGVDEDNACVAPDVIAAGIAAGWLSRGEDDKGIMRLRIAEGQEAGE